MRSQRDHAREVLSVSWNSINRSCCNHSSSADPSSVGADSFLRAVFEKTNGEASGVRATMSTQKDAQWAKLASSESRLQADP